MDFVADDLTGGCKLRTLTLLDLFTRQCLDIAVGRGLTGQDVVTTLERLRFDRGVRGAAAHLLRQRHPHRALKGLSPNEYARRAVSPAAESLS